MELGLKGKSVIVTGGGSNIGRAIVLALASEGCHVTIAEIDQPQGEKVANEAAALNVEAEARFIQTDVTDQMQVKNMADQVIRQEGAIDGLVNNVGWTVDRLFLEKPREEWEKEINLNLWSSINCMSTILPHMVDRGNGSIVSIASDAGRMGEYREAVYSACKGGVIALTKAVSREVGRYGVRLNTVCPGLTVPESPDDMGENSMWVQMADIFTPDTLARAQRGYALRRMGTAQEVANATIFLASDAASFITGQTLSVSGGYTMM